MQVQAVAKPNGCPATFFDEFDTVLATVPPLPGEEALYEQFRSLTAAAYRDPAIKKLITDEIIGLDKTLVKDFIQWKYNGKSRQWMESFSEQCKMGIGLFQPGRHFQIEYV